MRDIGYMAQRSSNPKAVLDFLNALPPGTLESGIDNIPLDEVRKRFKLRSPKMTKALVKLGVHPDVVAGYYAGFANQEAECRVYHMTTFPYPKIMQQQSVSRHFRSCMYSGAFGDERGAYYDDYIHDDVTAYESGNLGMLVVGKHGVKIATETGEHTGDGEGFRMRAKIRLLYRQDTDELSCILVDRVYGQKQLLTKALKTLLEWSSFAYPGVPAIITSTHFTNWTDADRFDTKHTLYYPHCGYQDTLDECYSDKRAVFAQRVSPFLVVSEDLLLSAHKTSSQLKVYKAYRETPELWEEMLPPEKLYVNRGSNSISKLPCKDLHVKRITRSRTHYTMEHCRRLGIFNTRLVNLLRILQFEQRSKPLFEDGCSVSRRICLGGGWNLNLHYEENRYTGYRNLSVILRCVRTAYYFCTLHGNYDDDEGALNIYRDYLENHSSVQDDTLLAALKDTIKLIVNMVYLEPIDKTQQRSYNSGVAYLRRMHEQIRQLRDCAERLKEL